MKNVMNNDFHILDEDVAMYLDIKVNTIKNRLQNKYSKNKVYFENVDYVRVYKNKETRSISYMMNYPTFERICMTSDSLQGEVVRLYFTKLREFIRDNAVIFNKALEEQKCEELKKYQKFETIYFFAVDETEMIKPGKAGDILKRIRSYNVGRLKGVDVKYLALVKHRKLIEDCMKLKLVEYQVIEGREIYSVKPDNLKKIIDKCYCKYVSKEEDEELKETFKNMFGFYGYVKDKKKIKPFVVIDKSSEL